MTVSATFEALLNSLAEHRATGERLSVLDDFSAHFASTLDSIAEIPERKGAHFKATAKRYVFTLLRFNFVALVCRRKVDAVASMLEGAVEARNGLALAHASRALIEHVAVLAAIARKLNAFTEAIKGQTDPVKIHEALDAGESFLKRCYFGRSPKAKASEGAVEALHINDCLKDLESRCAGAIQDYDFLCEYVHPNYGSNALVSTADEVRMTLGSIVSDFSRPEIEKMGDSAVRMMQVTDEIETHIAASVARLGRFVQAFLLPGAKVTNVFARKKVKPVGDGKTVESALCFDGAYGAEAIELLYEYLGTKAFTVHERRVLSVNEDGAVVDLFLTNAGPIFVKTNYS